MGREKQSVWGCLFKKKRRGKGLKITLKGKEKKKAGYEREELHTTAAQKTFRIEKPDRQKGGLKGSTELRSKKTGLAPRVTPKLYSEMVE